MTDESTQYLNLSYEKIVRLSITNLNAFRSHLIFNSPYSKIFKIEIPNQSGHDFYSLKLYFGVLDYATNKKNQINEYTNLRDLNHPNIQKVFAASSGEGKTPFNLFGYCCTSFEERIKKYVFASDLFRDLFLLVDAVLYLHDNLVVHRNIKMSNVMFDMDGVLKLVGFLFSKRIGSLDEVLSEKVGSTDYIAPQIVNYVRKYNYKCDSFSFGVLLKKTLELCEERLRREVSKYRWFGEIIRVCRLFDEHKRFDFKEIKRYFEIFYFNTIENNLGDSLRKKHLTDVKIVCII